MKTILLVEDDQEYGTLMETTLMKNQYAVTFVTDPLIAIEESSKNHFDLVISDLHLGIMDGIRLTKTIKNLLPEIKVIILTGFPDESSELEAMDSPVDMYLVKEKSINVILGYIDRVLNQEPAMQAAKESRLESKIEGILLLKHRREVYKNDQLIELTPKEFGILEYFLKNKKQSLTRQDIIREVWSVEPSEVEERAVDVHIKHLREKMKIFSIISIRGHGYKWNE